MDRYSRRIETPGLEIPGVRSYGKGIPQACTSYRDPNNLEKQAM